MLAKVSAFFVTILLLAGSFGLSHMGMTMSMDGHMTGCPFMPGMSVCTMTPMQMIDASHSFLSHFALGESLISLLLLIATALAVSTFATLFSPPKIIPRYRLPKWKLRFRYSFLDEAFSNGILNPKLF